MDRIRKNGLLLSEYEEGVSPRPYHFPQRNRIISGICESTVVVEAARGSGSLITAELAAAQGRNVYSVPGYITSGHSFGANMLIRDGAVPLIVIDDLISDMGVSLKSDDKIKVKLGKDERIVYDFLVAVGETTVDRICEESMMSPEKVNSIVTILEIKGLVDGSMGKIFIV